MEFSMTAKELVEIYEAGINRGNEIATAYEWGSMPSGSRLDELENVLIWDSTGVGLCKDMDYDHKVAWWEDFKNAIK